MRKQRGRVFILDKRVSIDILKNICSILDLWRRQRGQVDDS